MKDFIFLQRITKGGNRERDIVLNLNSISFMEPTTYENNGKIEEGTLIQLKVNDKILYVKNKIGSIMSVMEEKLLPLRRA